MFLLEKIFRMKLSTFLFFFCLLAYPQLSANLVLHIDANDSSSYDGSGTLINDLSSSSNNLRIVNDVTHVSDSDGYFSFNFGGRSDYLKLNSPPFNNLTDGTNYSILMLVDRSGSTNEQDLINYGRSTVSINGEFILTKKSNNRLRFWDYKSGYGFGNNNSSESYQSLSSNSFDHIAFVKSGTTGKFYFNGVLDRTIIASKNIVDYDGSYFYVGGDVRDSREWFDGKISSLRIYTDALSDDRVMGEYLTSQLKTEFLLNATSSGAICLHTGG